MSIFFSLLAISVLTALTFFALRFLHSTMRKLQDSHNALKEAFLALQKAGEHQDMFLATMSHEIRTPLNGLVGLLDVFPTATPSQREDMVITMKLAADQLVTTINDILDLSKLKAGKLILEPSIIDISELLLHCVSLFRPSAEEKGLALELNISPLKSQQILADGHRLQQICCNLLSNAVKFTDSGKVEVALHEVEEEGNEFWMQLTIRDTGIGMSAEVVCQLFQPFMQADATINRKFGGTGLGLSIIHSIVKLMGGDVHVTSTPGQGTSFDVKIPIVHAASSLNPLARDPQSPFSMPSGKVVVVVDDTPLNRVVAQKLGEAFGVHMLPLCNGLECITFFQILHGPFLPTQQVCNRDLLSASMSPELQAALDWMKNHSEYQVDAVLMDIHMPLMNGFEATQVLRRNGFLLPIVALTADVTPATRQQALMAGASQILTKPVRREALRRALLEAFHGGHMIGETSEMLPCFV